jgi:DASS family divalent anion:Na+ symporter
VAFVLMVSGWIFADHLKLNVTSIAFAGLGVLLMTNVLTLDDIAKQGDTLDTFLWLAVLFALSGQLNELGTSSYFSVITAQGGSQNVIFVASGSSPSASCTGWAS